MTLTLPLTLAQCWKFEALDQNFRLRRMLITSQRPRIPETMYPMIPRAGKPKSKGLTPVVIIMEEATIKAAIMMPRVSRLVMFSKVLRSPPRFACWNRIFSSPRSIFSMICLNLVGNSFCRVNRVEKLRRRSRQSTCGFQRSMANLLTKGLASSTTLSSG